jgi:DNA-binding CsgD family transcriptional regulator
MFQQERSRLRLALLAFFSSFSYLMIVAAAFAYWFVNVDNGDASQISFAAMVFIGMGALELSLPELVSAEYSLRMPGKTRLILVSLAVWTALQAPALWLGLLGDLSWIHIILAFIPFLSIVSWSMVRSFRHRPKLRRSMLDVINGLLYLAALALGARDVWELNHHASQDIFVALSLPMVYALTSWQFITMKADASPVAPGGMALELPASLAATLTPREQEMARLILDGQGNKEIAASLELSENTVRNHIYNLYQKLGIQKRMDLITLIKGKTSTGT